MNKLNFYRKFVPCVFKPLTTNKMSEEPKQPIRITMRANGIRVSVELPAETANEEIVESIKRIVSETIETPQPFEL